MDPLASQPRLLVTRKLPEEVEARIARSYRAEFNGDDRLIGPEELAAIAQAIEPDGLLVTPTDKMTPEVIDTLPGSVKIIATFSVGYDHINVPAAANRGIMVTNTPDVLTNATADIALLLMLGAARGAYWGERMVRENRWGAWSPTHPLGADVTGKRLGIYGMGRIGQAVARRARGFEMEIHYHNRRRLDPAEEQGAIFHQTLEDMLPHCDFLSINCASTPETRGSIDARRIALMPRGAIVVNTARGDIVDDDALIEALTSGHLLAAGLDVFKGEPAIDPRYRSLENVFLLPHLGSATTATRLAMGNRAVDNLDAFFRGERPRDVVHP